MWVAASTGGSVVEDVVEDVVVVVDDVVEVVVNVVDVDEVVVGLVVVVVEDGRVDVVLDPAPFDCPQADTTSRIANTIDVRMRYTIPPIGIVSGREPTSPPNDCQSVAERCQCSALPDDH